MINLWKNCHDSLVFLVIADEWWLINNLSLTRVIILCCLLLLNMASSCFHYGSSSSSLFLDNASWLHQDLFDPFFWGLTWLYLVLLTNPRTAEKSGHLEWFPLPSFQWHHIEVIISHPDVWISSKYKKLCIMMHHALWAIGITKEMCRASASSDLVFSRTALQVAVQSSFFVKPLVVEYPMRKWMIDVNHRKY